MFDDDYESTYTLAYPELKNRNMVATTYIISNYLDGGGITSAQLKILYDNGWDIGNHTQTHANLTTLTQAQIETEITNCKVVLDGLGMTRASKHVAYPYGGYNVTVGDAMTSCGAKTGRGGGTTSLSNIYEDENWPYRLNWTGPGTTPAVTKDRIDKAINQNATAFLVYHELSASLTVDKTSISDFIEVLDYIESLGLQTLTIDEYYRLYSGPITVDHK